MEELQAALAKSQKMCETISAALEVEHTRKADLLAALEAAGLPAPAAAPAEEAPTAHVSPLEQLAGGDDACAGVRAEWAAKQAEARAKLAEARAERAHCRAMETALAEAGRPLPAPAAAP